MVIKYFKSAMIILGNNKFGINTFEGAGNSMVKNKEFDLLALGEILLRLSSPINERLTRGDVFQKQAGGAELNVVSGLSLLGLRTGITLALGQKTRETVQEMIKSFTKDYPIRVVAATQRIVHSPKIHSFGSCIYNAMKDYFVQEPPYEKIDVVDRIGSGDAYISGALYGLLAYNMDCQKALEYGNATAAVKNTIPGDLPSSNLKEIDSIIKNHQSSGPQLEMNR